LQVRADGGLQAIGSLPDKYPAPGMGASAPGRYGMIGSDAPALSDALHESLSGK